MSETKRYPWTLTCANCRYAQKHEILRGMSITLYLQTKIVDPCVYCGCNHWVSDR